MLVHGRDILAAANRQGYAVGAFNVNNMEQIQAVISAAEQKLAPVVIQISESAIKYAGLHCLSKLIINLAEQSFIPIVFHLDHGKTYDIVVQCIRNGLTSVMIDTSDLPLEDNIKKTAEVVKVAHACGVSVEAELGQITGHEDNFNVLVENSTLTTPEEAAFFVSETGIDSLAIAIGNSHGQYNMGMRPRLDFEQLKKIKELVHVPLVLHGASGLNQNDLKQAIICGIGKVNINTDLMQVFGEACKEILLTRLERYDVRKLCGRARDMMIELIKEKINILGSAKQCLGR
ncbi:MAG: class II fructose-bisphosphate aldolase family protein [Oscillospiraceae bacterium]|jgi:fructose-bisphosphate aldolase class II|nr:class II fructose-bisphosphate aldolase family protein [Oscillospiraceae bacterium]